MARVRGREVNDMRYFTRTWLLGLVVTVLLAPVEVGGQTSSAYWRAPADNVIMPQARSAWRPRPAAVRFTGVIADVIIREQVATTTLDIKLHNPGNVRQEAELLVPVPDGAVVRGFDFEGSAKEPTAVLLPKDEARKTYDNIVARVKDPALLEFIGFNLVRSSVFPVEANSTQTIRLTYENVLTAEGDRVDYFLPRSESVDYAAPWEINLTIESKRAISTVYSPSHRLEVPVHKETKVTARLAKGSGQDPGPFRLSYLLQKNGVTATLFAYPDPKFKGGYFLMLAGLPPKPAHKGDGPVIRREVTLVIDRSGSMAGEKLEQTKAAARQVIAGLDVGEAFNLIMYNEGVDMFSSVPLIKNPGTEKAAFQWIDSITARGGTNIHDALVEALRLKPGKGMLPIVLFMTDGLPTIGQTSEVAIRSVATDGNKAGKRIFTFGVGVDVNTPLLTAISHASRGFSTFVLPKEDVEVKVARVFNALSGPILADASFETVDKKGKHQPGRVTDVLPRQLPDLFQGDQLVLLGRYLGEEPLGLKFRGNYQGKEKEFTFTFDLDNATTRNSFVPRLWASRKIAVLVDQIRQAGADLTFSTDIARIANDPRFTELVDEIVRLSTEFGILTEYTAFLAREGTDLSRQVAIMHEARDNFINRAVKVRSGWGSVSQSVNNDHLGNQQQLNPRNVFYDDDMNQVDNNSVQQMGDRAFYRRGGRWVDSRVANKQETTAPARVVEFGSDEYGDLALELVEDGRQGAISMEGDTLLEVNGEEILIRND